MKREFDTIHMDRDRNMLNTELKVTTYSVSESYSESVLPEIAINTAVTATICLMVHIRFELYVSLSIIGNLTPI